MESLSTPVGFPAGIWLNSCCFGANRYEVKTPPQFLEPGAEAFADTDYQTCFQQAVSLEGGSRFRLFETEPGEGLDRWLTEVFERMLPIRPNDPDLLLPLDIVTDGSHCAAVFREEQPGCVPIRPYLSTPDAPRWRLAISLFNRLRSLHGAGFCGDGFPRQQILVDPNRWEVRLLIGRSLRLPGDRSMPHLRRPASDFLFLPEKTLQTLEENGLPADGVLRDVFSAAVIAFYLLYYTHPFVGSAFRELTRPDMLPLYHDAPSFVFDPKGSNRLTMFDFERDSVSRWEQTMPALRALFEDLFCAVGTYGGQPADDTLSAAAWINALQEDEAKNSGETVTENYPFETTGHYRI